MSRQKQLQAATDAVRKASRVCRAVQADLVNAETIQKKDRSPVTVADFASQAIVCATLAEAFGDDAVVGEEGSADLRTDANVTARQLVTAHVAKVIDGATQPQVLDWIDRGAADGSGPRHWTIDPIDGTKGFLRNEQYAVALALIEGGRVVLGVLGCPNLAGSDGDGGGTLMYATDEGGAFAIDLDEEDAKPRGVSVDAISSPAEARFCESVESGHSDQDQSAMIAKRLGITAEPLRLDSQAKYATVARGDASIYLRLPTRPGYVEKIWDHAAGMFIVEQAGGRVTDIDGKPLDFSHGRGLSENRGVVATNGAVHDAVLEAVATTA